MLKHVRKYARKSFAGRSLSKVTNALDRIMTTSQDGAIAKTSRAFSRFQKPRVAPQEHEQQPEDDGEMVPFDRSSEQEVVVFTAPRKGVRSHGSSTWQEVSFCSEASKPQRPTRHRRTKGNSKAEASGEVNGKVNVVSRTSESRSNDKSSLEQTATGECRSCVYGHKAKDAREGEKRPKGKKKKPAPKRPSRPAPPRPPALPNLTLRV